MENCSCRMVCCCPEARLGGVEQISGSSCADWIRVPPIRLGGGFSSNVQSNLARLSSSSAGEQQMRVAGILGGWVLLTSCAEPSPASVWLPSILPSSFYIY
ncbi:hypothetical protein SLEP1_g55458 [Rubroshorea leprosula]|uniref:Uncharacterized protein n=1 Tax=Rubroshorea leprosula TaxID=152421 RepID=A0AAV5MJM6_9ROSI|nr:hypothetical protein SLEP1_g55458 [Rubroshorea leprosula]